MITPMEGQFPMAFFIRSLLIPLTDARLLLIFVCLPEPSKQGGGKGEGKSNF